MRPAVVVTGSLNMDFVVKVKHLPAPGETVLGHGFRMIPGGKGGNQAFAAARLGVNSVHVKMIGRIGQDSFGDLLKASLAGAGVDVSAVHTSRSQSTGAALISVDGQGQNSIVVAAGANAELLPGDAEAMRRVFRGAAVALFQLETPIATVAAALRIAREEGARTILDPAPAQPLSREILPLVDFLTPNETEAAVLGDVEVRNLILKLGPAGCRFTGGGETLEVPAPSVEAVDSTGAGDTFNAAFAVALAEGSSIPHALRFANRAAALSVTRMGAQSSVPSRVEVDALEVERWSE
jgi:ribokinase